MTQDEELEFLRARVPALESRVRELESALMSTAFEFPNALGLTKDESDLLNMLMSFDRVTHEAWLATRRKVSEPGDSTLRVRMHNIRRKLHPIGVSVSARNLQGWSISKSDKARLAAEITRARQPARSSL